MVDLIKIKKALQIEPHTNLYELANSTTEKSTGNPGVVAKPTDGLRHCHFA